MPLTDAATINPLSSGRTRAVSGATRLGLRAGTRATKALQMQRATQ